MHIDMKYLHIIHVSNLMITPQDLKQVLVNKK